MQVLAVKATVEADVQRMLTHLLSADVPGSGIDPEFIEVMSYCIIYSIPVLFALWMLTPCFCRRRRKAAATTSSATSSGPRKPKSSKRKGR